MPQPPPISSPPPDAAAIRLLAVPDSAPPFDDAAPRGSAVAGASAAGGDVTAPDGTALPAEGAPATPEPGPGPDGPAPGRGRPPGPAAVSPGDAAAVWTSRFAQVLAETLAGSRSQGQIAPWTSVQARRRIRQLGPMLTAGSSPRIHRIVTTRPAADVVEMTVVVGFGERVRALAVRLERDRQRHGSPDPGGTGQRWVCTAIEAA